MPDLILHAGAPKTGTSYLQVLFAREAERLRAAGIVYPRGHLFDEAAKGAITSGNGLELANYVRPGLPHTFPDKAGLLAKVEGELAQADGRHVLYSSEFLLFPRSPQTQAVVDLAARYRYHIRFVYLVRDLAPAFLSFYSQQVKLGGETRPFGEFIAGWEPGYRNAIQSAVDAFGAENVEIYNYEEHRARLADLFFIDILGAGFSPQEAASINRSLSARELLIKRQMNAVIGKNGKASRFLSDALLSQPMLTQEPLTATAAEGELLRERFQADLDYINGMMRGRPIGVGNTQDRAEERLSETEAALATVMAHLAAAVVR